MVFMSKRCLIGFVFVLSLICVFAYPITGNSINTLEGDVEAGIMPDSFFYGVDVVLDNINIALSSKDNKAEKGLEIARERLLEVRAMVDENKFEKSLRAQEEYSDVLFKVEKFVSFIDLNDFDEEVGKKIEIEKDIGEHRLELEEIKDELRMKIDVRGNLSEESLEIVDSVLSNLDNSTKMVEIKIDEEKNKTKIKIKNETGRTEVEIEKRVKEIEEEKGLTQFKEEAALRMSKRASDRWEGFVERSEEANLTLPEKSYYDELMRKGDEAVSKGNYEEAKDYYEKAKDYMEDMKEGLKEYAEGLGKDIRIEIESESNYSKVKINIMTGEIEFESKITDVNQLVKEISSRTDLTEDEIKSNMRVEYKKKYDNFKKNASKRY